MINIWGLLLWANIVTQTQEPVLEMRWIAFGYRFYPDAWFINMLQWPQRAEAVSGTWALRLEEHRGGRKVHRQSWEVTCPRTWCSLLCHTSYPPPQALSAGPHARAWCTPHTVHMCYNHCFLLVLLNLELVSFGSWSFWSRDTWAAQRQKQAHPHREDWDLGCGAPRSECPLSCRSRTGGLAS